MPRVKPSDLPPELQAKLADFREREKEVRANLVGKKIEEILTPEELANATPYYFELRSFVVQLRKAREAAGLSAAEVARRTGLAAETISRLETGAYTNPTYQTLARYAAAVGVRLVLTAETGG
ncbi:MAG TPA: helix-turn-helix domain-containing protein [Fimbriiglobus sp.]|nr:helix-turn-helix domain-containing protein [Fimbriiglobus sp.]